MNSISPNLNLMIKSCERVSKVLIRDFGEVEKLQVSVKGPKNFVTNSDKKVEDMLVKELSKSKKKYSFLTEESGFIKNKDTENFWVIDPIDGTTNFINGVPHFCISVGLVLDNEIVSGVIYDPIKDEIYYAEKNSGAYMNNKSIRVSRKRKISECLFSSNSNKISSDGLSIRITGSAALDLAYVSCGRFDGCFHKNLSLWDIAAGSILVKEAGGVLSNIDLKKTENISLIASNQSIEKEINNKISMF
ncbi:inositol monophosphatase [Candidatus Pelagibacter sp.]|nr:inositol monophosphatase [Candidatus Pelagibacter sp.]